jgi:beta-lactamase superfamily II metal-dependent hydrolase
MKTSPPLLILALVFVLAGPLPAANLLIDCLDVGQGDCTVITSPSGKSLLIDGGDEGRGTSTVIPFLRQRGMTDIDYLVATHYHQDHIGGLDEVIYGGFTPTVAYDRGYSYGTQAYTNYVQAVGSARTTIQRGQTIDLGGGVLARCVAVNGNGDPGASTENDFCVALVISYGGFQFFIAGDLPGYDDGGYADIESSVATDVGNLEVLRVNHHGSLYSSNTYFLRTLDPEASIISLGENGNGYPHQVTLDRLVAAGTYIYQTELGNGGTILPGHGEVVNGDIAIVTDGTHYTVNGDRYVIDGYVSDTIPPVISGITVEDLAATSATIRWTTNEPADSRVEYGLSTAYGSSVEDTAYVTSHSIVLDNLLPQTVYHFKVHSRDRDWNAAESSDRTLTTHRQHVYTTRAVRVTQGTIFSGSYLDLAADDQTYMVVRSGSSGTDWLGGVAVTENPPDVLALEVVYNGSYSMPRTQKLYLYNFQTRRWVQVDSRSVNNTDATITYRTTNASPYVSSTGRVGLRVQASGAQTFYCHADYLAFAIELP